MTATLGSHMLMDVILTHGQKVFREREDNLSDRLFPSFSIV